MKVRSIEKIRQWKEIKVDDMAQQLGLSERQYRRYEQGESDWTLSLLEQVAGIFKMTVPEVLSFDEKVVFHQCDQAHAFGSNNTYNAANAKERELYEARINELKELVLELKSEVAELRNDKEQLRAELREAKLSK